MAPIRLPWPRAPGPRMRKPPWTRRRPCPATSDRRRSCPAPHAHSHDQAQCCTCSPAHADHLVSRTRLGLLVLDSLRPGARRLRPSHGGPRIPVLQVRGVAVDYCNGLCPDCEAQSPLGGGWSPMSRPTLLRTHSGKRGQCFEIPCHGQPTAPSARKLQAREADASLIHIVFIVLCPVVCITDTGPASRGRASLLFRSGRRVWVWTRLEHASQAVHHAGGAVRARRHQENLGPAQDCGVGDQGAPSW